MTPHILRKLCRDAIEFSTAAEGDHIFEPFKAAEHLYTCVKGELDYISEDNLCFRASTLGDSSTGGVVPRGSWLAQPALWCHWTYAGTAKAREGGASLMTLGAQGFIAAVREEPLLQELAWEYSQNFHKLLMWSIEGCETRPDDLQYGMAYNDEVVFGAQAPVRIFLGLVAVSLLQRQQAMRNWQVFTRARSLSALETEVRNQKCTLVVTNTGEVKRVTAVACVQVTRADGRIWVQLGKMKDDKVVLPTCALPGVKMQDGANVLEMMDVVRSGELAFFRGKMRMGKVVRGDQEKYSQTYGIYTRYLRHVQHAAIDDEIANEATMNLTNFVNTVSLRSARPVTHMASTLSKIPHICDDLYVNSDGAVLFVSAWLTPEQFQHFQTPQGHASLEKLLRVSHLHDGMREAAHRTHGVNSRSIRLSGQRHLYNGDQSTSVVDGTIFEETEEYTRISSPQHRRTFSKHQPQKEEERDRIEEGVADQEWSIRELDL